MLENPFYYNEELPMNEANKQRLEALKAKLEIHADTLLVGIAASDHSWSIVASAGGVVLAIGVALGWWWF